MFLLYSDGNGNIFEDESLLAVGRSGWDAFPVPSEDWIPLPDGGSLYELPGRRGIGIDVVSGEMRLCEKGWAVAAFIPPAHTGLYLAIPFCPSTPAAIPTAIPRHRPPVRAIARRGASWLERGGNWREEITPSAALNRIWAASGWVDGRAGIAGRPLRTRDKERGLRPRNDG